MFVDFSKLLWLTMLDGSRRAWRQCARQLPLTAMVLSWPAAIAETLCAWRMETMVRRLGAMGRKIDLVHAELRSGRNVESIEADLHFRRMLAVVRNDMQVLRHEAAAWQRDREARITSARLGAALGAVAGISERVYRMADALLGELDERDRRQGHRQHGIPPA